MNSGRESISLNRRRVESKFLQFKVMPEANPLSCAVRRNLVWCAVICSILLIAAVLVNGKEQSAEPKSGSQATPRSAEAASRKSTEVATPKSNAVALARGPVVNGEHFTLRQIPDHQQGGLPVCVFTAPEKWRDNSQVVWNYANHSSPVKMGASAENPTNEEAFFLYPAAEFFALWPSTGYYQPGQNVGGLIFAQPMPPAQTLLAFIQQVRAGNPKLQLIGSKDLPDLPKALQLPPSQNQRGVGIKITYELKGKPVEEEFYGVAYAVDIPYDGPQGRTWQKNWGLNALHSFRAPLGALDRRRDVFAAIAKSFRPNPAWQQRLAAVNAYLAAEFNRQLQAGYDSIAAAGRLSRQISANNDAMIASIDRQLQATRTSSSGSATRSSADKFSDYIRGVDTVDDPHYGTSQHAYTEKYHWTDGYGTYRNSNDATYNPNQTEKGDWQLMQPAR
ncbi:MAG: hypothetical protein DME26_01665 [Verrucomicrobia bacterium]|nr:MAG: hypothetical protein DME26_01665 [Verrucomicrobiota bacterium]